jgi:hypothetical protein
MPLLQIAQELSWRLRWLGQALRHRHEGANTGIGMSGNSVGRELVQ